MQNEVEIRITMKDEQNLRPNSTDYTKNSHSQFCLAQNCKAKGNPHNNERTIGPSPQFHRHPQKQLSAVLPRRTARRRKIRIAMKDK